MRDQKLLLLGLIFLLVTGCSAVKLPEANTYQISAYSAKRLAKNPRPINLLVSNPDAVAGYQTGQMLYMQKPYLVEKFANNAWVSPPSDMLFPLLLQSLQSSGYFHAVSSTPYAQGANYRLDTQLIRLEQNFLNKPSSLHLSVKVILTNLENNRLVSSRMINIVVPCGKDSPYGGVLAANEAAKQLTAAVTQFVVKSI